MTELTVIILTKDESMHIARAIFSVRDVASRVIVVDSGSSDGTVEIAKRLGATVLRHGWVNHATQFNWALDQITGTAGWVLRLDADEVITQTLADEIKAGLPEDADGCYVGRGIKFMGQLVKHGGVFSTQTLRLFRYGQGRCEQLWMDEHIVVAGPTARLRGHVIDDNRHPLDWCREVVDVLNAEFAFLPCGGALPGHGRASVKRWVKRRIYERLPAGVRAGGYFFYRYVLRLGFLDGGRARSFHVLQGFWYRYLVDAKLCEVRRYMAANGASPVKAIKDVLGIDVIAPSSAQKVLVA